MIIDKAILLSTEDRDDNNIMWDYIPESQEEEYFDKNSTEIEILAYNELDKYMLIKTTQEWSTKNGFISPISKTPILRFECERIGDNLFRFRKYYFDFLIFEKEVI